MPADRFLNLSKTFVIEINVQFLRFNIRLDERENVYHEKEYSYRQKRKEKQTPDD